MISFLQSPEPISIGAMLGTDFNQGLLSEDKNNTQKKALLEQLTSAGYEHVIGIVPSGDAIHESGELTGDVVRQACLYSIEKDLPFLLSNEPVSTLNDRYLLIETDTQTPSSDLEDAVLQLQLKGYIPVLIQAERYEYLQDNYRNIQRLQDRGCLLQTNILSLTGSLGTAAKRLAKKLIHGGFASFIGSGITTPDEHEKSQALLHSRKLAKLLQAAQVKNRELVF